MELGKIIEVDGIKYVSPSWYDDGLSNGLIYKNQSAFDSNSGVCYIPEGEFDDAESVTISGELFYPLSEICGYTRADLEKLIKDVEDVAEIDRINIEDFFQSLLWAYPETYIYEITY